MSNVLLLNANATPVSLLPLSVISWQDAVRYLWLNMVVVLHEYQNWQVHSPSTTMTVPSVVMLRKQVRYAGYWFSHGSRPQASLVFLRDMYQCQYCSQQFSRRQLTIDHVIPKFYGGKTLWENVATACERCNCERGCNTAIKPRRQPFRPNHKLLISNLRQFPITVPHLNWNDYLGWDQGKVHLGTIGGGIIHDTVDLRSRISSN